MRVVRETIVGEFGIADIKVTLEFDSEEEAEKIKGILEKLADQAKTEQLTPADESATAQ